MSAGFCLNNNVWSAPDKQTERLNIRLCISDFEKLEQLSEATGMNKSLLVRAMINELYESYFKKEGDK